MEYRTEIKEKAIELRKDGYSLKEIAEKLKISKSTASVWLSPVKLSSFARKRLAKRKVLGQHKTVLLKKSLRDLNQRANEEKAYEIVKNITLSRNYVKLCCALIWWCEGNKDEKVVRFTSSDKTLIQNFLRLFRFGFIVDESKFRALIHLHSYHNDINQKSYWSRITKIPLSQFYKSYQKINSGKRIKDGYSGCIAISYYDARIAKELKAIYNTFTNLGAFVNG